ncbi:hypothetical protein WR25_12751 [Diploscapter pachys]|uniref:Caveolin n=1 Tax=Diploscapter pachys TaxID=2018661 RepID=A0A2A2JVJ2_9BILA|nr:hypothetical protein WR25_12751 [Diploscapter pachys]
MFLLSVPSGYIFSSAAPSSNVLSWFVFKKKPAAEVVAETTEEGNVEKPKKKCWWSKGKCEGEQKDEHISIGINLVDRDEKAINEHVKFAFEDVFGEADTQHSWDCVWRLIYRIFTWTRLFFYRLFALLVGIPAALIFGLLYAIFIVLNTFACIPLGKLLSIPGNWIAKAWNWLVHALIDPLASAVGLIFSSFTIRKYGINSQPTDPCVA